MDVTYYQQDVNFGTFTKLHLNSKTGTSIDEELEKCKRRLLRWCVMFSLLFQGLSGGWCLFHLNMNYIWATNPFETLDDQHQETYTTSLPLLFLSLIFNEALLDFFAFFQKHSESRRSLAPKPSIKIISILLFFSYVLTVISLPLGDLARLEDKSSLQWFHGIMISKLSLVFVSWILTTTQMNI